MPPKKVKLLPSELINLLEAERRTFSEDLHDLTDSQRKQYELCLSLFHTDDTGFSRQRGYTRGRARSFLTDVQKAMGADVLLLSILAAAISRLGTVSSKDAVPAIRQWWSTVSHPRCLTTIAMPVPAALGLADAPHDPTPTPSNPQTQPQTLPQAHPPVQPQAHPQAHLQAHPQAHPQAHLQGYAQAQHQPHHQSHPQVYPHGHPQAHIQPQASPQTNPQTLVPLLRPPRVSHQDLSYMELLGFFQTHLRSSHLRLACPLAAPPFLHLDLGTEQGGTAVIQFSIGGGEALIEYLRMSRETRLPNA